MSSPFPYVFCSYRRGQYLWFRLANRLLVTVKGPQVEPVFSERHGYRRPILRWRGWRLFIKRDRMA